MHVLADRTRHLRRICNAMGDQLAAGCVEILTRLRRAAPGASRGPAVVAVADATSRVETTAQLSRRAARTATSSVTSSCSTRCSGWACTSIPNQFEPMFLSTAHTPADIARCSNDSSMPRPSAFRWLTPAIAAQRGRDIRGGFRHAAPLAVDARPRSEQQASVSCRMLSPEPILAAIENYRGTARRFRSRSAVDSRAAAQGVRRCFAKPGARRLSQRATA